MRARLALQASGQVCELREVVLASKPAALLQASPKGTVPVLVAPDGTVIDQSLEIMLWTLKRHDPARWLSVKGVSLETMLEWVARCDGDFKFHLDRSKYQNRFGLAQSSESRLQCAVFLKELNQQLREQRYVMGAHWSLVDAAVAPFVRQFALTDTPWFASQPWPELQIWLTAFEDSAMLQQAMERTPAWQVGQAPVFSLSPNLLSIK